MHTQQGLYRCEDLDELHAAVRALDPELRGVPVLLREYLKLGGRFAAFHVDRSFGDALDCLVFVDLDRANDRALQRYLGRDGLATFRAAGGRRLTSRSAAGRP